MFIKRPDICIQIIAVLLSTFTTGILAENSESQFIGTLSVLSICNDDNTHTTTYMLKTEDKKYYKLTGFEQAEDKRTASVSEGLFEASISAAKSNDKITVTGTLLSKDEIDVFRIEVLEVDSNILRTFANAEKTSIPIVMVISWGNDATEAMSRARNMMTKTKEIFPKVSYGQHNFNNDGNNDGEMDIIGPIKLGSSTPSGCSPYEIADQADRIARSEYGVDFNNYNHRVYLFSQNLNCGWGGLGSISCVRMGNDCRNWVNYQRRSNDIAEVYYHELGHNIGLGHAQMNGNEYGDTSDAMGRGGWVFFNAANTDEMGWFQAIPGSVHIPKLMRENIKIYPMALEPEKGGIRALKYLDRNTNYYLSYRTRIGADEDLNSGSEFVNSISIHSIRSDGRAGNNSDVVKVIQDGESWASPNGKVKVAVEVGSDASHKNLQVSYSDGEDVDPIVITKQPLAQTVASGESATLSVEAQGANLKYQWFKDSTAMTGETSKILTIPGFTSQNTGNYFVEIKDEFQQVFSNSVLIKTDTDKPLVILSDLEDREVSEGSNITLKVISEGTGVLSFQWEKDGIALEGETSDSLQLTNITRDDAGLYKVKVSDFLQSLYSNSANVNVSEKGKWKVVSFPIVTPEKKGDSSVGKYELVLATKDSMDKKKCLLLAGKNEQVCEFDIEYDQNSRAKPFSLSFESSVIN